MQKHIYQYFYMWLQGYVSAAYKQVLQVLRAVTAFTHHKVFKYMFDILSCYTCFLYELLKYFTYKHIQSTFVHNIPMRPVTWENLAHCGMSEMTWFVLAIWGYSYLRLTRHRSTVQHKEILIRKKIIQNFCTFPWACACKIPWKFWYMYKRQPGVIMQSMHLDQSQANHQS